MIYLSCCGTYICVTHHANRLESCHDTEAVLSWLNVETQSSGGWPGPLAVTYTVKQTRKCNCILPGVSCWFTPHVCQ